MRAGWGADDFRRSKVIRHSGESRNPEAARTAFVALDTGFRRYDENESPAHLEDGPGSMH